MCTSPVTLGEVNHGANRIRHFANLVSTIISLGVGLPFQRDTECLAAFPLYEIQELISDIMRETQALAPQHP